MSIYDPSNDDDFRYSQYSTERTVVFEDVEPGYYRAHVTSAYTMGQSAFNLTIDEGDDILIVFTYYYSNGYRWKYEITRLNDTDPQPNPDDTQCLSSCDDENNNRRLACAIGFTDMLRIVCEDNALDTWISCRESCQQ